MGVLQEKIKVKKMGLGSPVLPAEAYRRLLALTCAWPGTRRKPGSLIVLPRPIRVGNPLFWCTQDARDVLAMVKYFRKDRDFVALRSTQGVLMPTPDNIRALALHYVDEILDFQPGGPFMLGGYCVGGRVALEIARELMRRGHDVPFLALVEIPIPTLGTFVSRKIYRLFYRHIHGLLYGPPDARMRYLKEWLYRISARVPNGATEPTRGKHYRALLLNVRERRRLLAQWKTEYQSTRYYNGCISLFFGRYGPLGCYRFSLFNKQWHQIARGGFEVHTIPSDHHVFREPHAKSLIEALQCCLQSKSLGPWDERRQNRVIL